MPHQDTVFLKSSVVLLSFLEPEQLRRVTPDIEHSTYAKGQPVIFKGEITGGFYIIKKGSAVAHRKNGKADEAEPLKTGDFFGVMSVLDDVASVESVKAAEDGTEVLTIPHASFEKLLEAFPAIKKGLQDHLKARQK